MNRDCVDVHAGCCNGVGGLSAEGAAHGSRSPVDAGPIGCVIGRDSRKGPQSNIPGKLLISVCIFTSYLPTAQESCKLAHLPTGVPILPISSVRPPCNTNLNTVQPECRLSWTREIQSLYQSNQLDVHLISVQLFGGGLVLNREDGWMPTVWQLQYSCFLGRGGLGYRSFS